MSVAPAADEVARYRHGRVPRAVRERQVIAVAERLFAEQGYAATSMDELCRRVGVSKPVIYALIGSKERLYRRCVERMAAELAQEITAAAKDVIEPRAQMEVAALAFFRFVAGRRRLWEALALDAGPFAADAAAIRERQNQLVAGLLLRAAHRAGTPVDRRAAGAVASAVNGAIEGLARWWRDQDDVSADDLTSLAVRLLMPGLEGLLAG